MMVKNGHLRVIRPNQLVSFLLSFLQLKQARADWLGFDRGTNPAYCGQQLDERITCGGDGHHTYVWQEKPFVTQSLSRLVSRWRPGFCRVPRLTSYARQKQCPSRAPDYYGDGPSFALPSAPSNAAFGFSGWRFPVLLLVLQHMSRCNYTSLTCLHQWSFRSHPGCVRVGAVDLAMQLFVLTFSRGFGWPSRRPELLIPKLRLWILLHHLPIPVS